MTDNECELCQENTYSGAGASFCTSCPYDGVSEAGSSSIDDCKYGMYH